MTQRILIGVSEDITRTSYFRNLYSNMNTSQLSFKKIVSVKEYIRYLFVVNIFHLHWPEKRFRMNTLYFSFFRTIIMIILISLFRLRKGKFVVTAHNLKPHISQSRLLDYFILLYSYRTADRVIVHSIATKKKIQKFYRIKSDRIRVIKMGSTSYEYFNKNITKAQSAQILQIDGSKKIISMLGNLVAYKGVEFFVELANKILEKNSEFLFLLAGRCNDKHLIEVIEKTRIKFPENILFINRYISNKLFPHYFSITDLGLLPFERITDSSSFEAYLRYHRPILSRYFPSLKEIAGNFAFYLHGNEIKNWTKTILDLFHHGKIVEKRNYIIAHYHPHKWASSAKETVELYRELIYPQNN